MTSAQLIISVLIISLLLKTSYSYLKKKNIPLGFFLLWLFFWFFALFLVNNIPVLTTFSKLVGIGRGVDLAIYLSIIIIYYFIYYLITENYRLKKQITKITRYLAISEFKKEKKKKLTF